MNNTSSTENSKAYNLFNTVQPIRTCIVFGWMCTGYISVWYKNYLTREGNRSWRPTHNCFLEMKIFPENKFTIDLKPSRFFGKTTRISFEISYWARNPPTKETLPGHDDPTTLRVLVCYQATEPDKVSQIRWSIIRGYSSLSSLAGSNDIPKSSRLPNSTHYVVKPPLRNTNLTRANEQSDTNPPLHTFTWAKELVLHKNIENPTTRRTPTSISSRPT